MPLSFPLFFNSMHDLSLPVFTFALQRNRSAVCTLAVISSLSFLLSLCFLRLPPLSEFQLMHLQCEFLSSAVFSVCFCSLLLSSLQFSSCVCSPSFSQVRFYWYLSRLLLLSVSHSPFRCCTLRLLDSDFSFLFDF
jgi:hypothetical protein